MVLAVFHMLQLEEKFYVHRVCSLLSAHTRIVL